jgi:hypothetical protein
MAAGSVPWTVRTAAATRATASEPRRTLRHDQDPAARTPAGRARLYRMPAQRALAAIPAGSISVVLRLRHRASGTPHRESQTGTLPG